MILNLQLNKKQIKLNLPLVVCIYNYAYLQKVVCFIIAHIKK